MKLKLMAEEQLDTKVSFDDNLEPVDDPSGEILIPPPLL